jgi:hypothetical protein
VSTATTDSEIPQTKIDTTKTAPASAHAPVHTHTEHIEDMGEHNLSGGAVADS